MRREKTFTITKSRIPKYRAVPNDLRRSATSAEFAQNRVRNVVNNNNYEKTVKKLPKEEVEENVVKTPKRRQWHSFNAGCQFMQSQENVEIIPPIIVDDVQEDTVENRQFSLSDSCLETLKEDLAKDGTPESLFQMAEDLLQDLDSLDSKEEVEYREEQAVFWLMKAAERGSEEALKTLKKIKQKEKGITERNSFEVSCFLSMSQEDLIGQRIGRRLCYDASNGRGFVPVFQLLNFPDKGWDHHGQDPEIILATKKSEKLSLNECVQAGMSYANNDLPEVDDKLMEYQVRHRSCSMFIFPLLVLLIKIKQIANILKLLVLSHFFQTLLAIFIYHWIISQQILYVFSNVIAISIFMTIPILTLHNLNSTLSKRHRMARWRKIFSISLRNGEENILAKRKLSSKNFDLSMQYLISGLVIISLHSNSASYQTSIKLLSSKVGLYIASIVLAGYLDKSDLLLIPIIVISDYYYFNDVIALIKPYTGDQIMSVLVQYPILIPMTMLVLPISLLKKNFQTILDVFSLVGLIGICINQDETNIHIIHLATAVNALSWIARVAFSKKSKVFNLITLIFVLCLASQSINLTTEETQKPLTWKDFRAICPRVGSPKIQVNCSQFLDYPVEWQGTMESIQITKRSVELPERVKDLTFAIWKGFEKEDNLDCKENSYICKLRKTLFPYAWKFQYPSQFGCNCKVKMENALFETSRDFVYLNIDSKNNNCTKFDQGDVVQFQGHLSQIYNQVHINVIYLS